ncbi:MAG: bifunctional adenosylcobinamide kinase/adenosylcobinamide-phosphate guanylyltransferase, partial [Mariprofundaceae bacterium]
SGKSHRADDLAEQSGFSVCYVATSVSIAGDAEWQERIEHHQKSRPNDWETIEEPTDLTKVLAASKKGQVILVDCLTLWLSNLMFEDRDIETKTTDLCAILKTCQGDVILVSNEVGMGLVPENKLGRAFRDAQGRLNQSVAEVADTVEFVVAGLPMTLKG